MLSLFLTSGPSVAALTGATGALANTGAKAFSQWALVASGAAVQPHRAERVRPIQLSVLALRSTFTIFTVSHARLPTANDVAFCSDSASRPPYGLSSSC